LGTDKRAIGESADLIGGEMMSYEFMLKDIPAGVSIESIKGPGYVNILTMELLSTEDGQEFIQRIEGLPETLLRQIDEKHQINRSQIDHMLVILHKNRKSSLFINELRLKTHIRTANVKKAGDFVYKNDILEVEQLDLGNVEIPKDAGIIFIFSVGWRKGLFYDYGPLAVGEDNYRSYDLNSLLGQFYSHIIFQERFSLSDDEWGELLSSQWFLFSGLKNDTIKDIINYTRNCWNIDELLTKISDEINEKLDNWLINWKSNSLFDNHIDIIETSIKHFKNEDYLSATGLIYPRIEGLLRSYKLEIDPSTRATQSNLSETAVCRKLLNEKSLLLPKRFMEYLKTVYFANFDPNDSDIKISRNSVGHGVASTESYNQKAATIGFLIVFQLSIYFHPIQIPEEQ
jgi:hypothetical protein